MQLVNVAVPRRFSRRRRQRSGCRGVAADGAVGQRERAAAAGHVAPMPLPPPPVAELPLTVQLVSVAVPPS